MDAPALVFVIDDDPQSRATLVEAARSLGAAARVASIADVVAQRREAPACVAAKLNSHPAFGVELIDALRRRGLGIPVLFMAEQARISDVVDVMQAGAMTVLQKPLDGQLVRSAIQAALELDDRRRQQAQARAEFRGRLQTLTQKERDVLNLLMEGAANKTMAAQLGASLRTIENRRRTLFAKLGVQSVAELVTQVLRVDDDAATRPVRA